MKPAFFSLAILKPAVLLLTTICCLGYFVSPANGGQKVTVGVRVPSAQQVSFAEIQHATWDALLKRYVDEQGNVNYAQWKSTAADMQALESYLKTLSRANPNLKSNPQQALAFWINAYNAVTVWGILREYPTTSIRNHTAKLFGYNIWDDLLLTVGGKPFSLNQMEHDILRKMGEPRIHFAIVCASKSCPRLLAQAYDADRLEMQLTENTKDFFANRQNFRFDSQQRRFYLSSILDWFGTDFGGTQTQQLQAIAPYLPTSEAQQAAARGFGTISFLAYDWGLNDQAGSNR